MSDSVMEMLDAMARVIDGLTPSELRALVEKVGLSKEGAAQCARIERMLLERGRQREKAEGSGDG